MTLNVLTGTRCLCTTHILYITMCTHLSWFLCHYIHILYPYDSSYWGRLQFCSWKLLKVSKFYSESYVNSETQILRCWAIHLYMQLRIYCCVLNGVIEPGAWRVCFHELTFWGFLFKNWQFQMAPQSHCGSALEKSIYLLIKSLSAGMETIC